MLALDVAVAAEDAAYDGGEQHGMCPCRPRLVDETGDVLFESSLGIGMQRGIRLLIVVTELYEHIVALVERTGNGIPPAFTDEAERAAAVLGMIADRDL